MKKFFTFLLFIITTIYATDINNITQVNVDENTTKVKQFKLNQEKKRKEKDLVKFLQELDKIEEQISQENMWMKSYASYLTSLDVRNSLQKIKKRIDYLTKHVQTVNDEDELNALISKKIILTAQIEKLKGKNSAPFTKLLTPPVIDEIPSISNPFEIFTGLSLVKTLNAGFDDYIKRRDSLKKLISLLERESMVYDKIALVDEDSTYTKESLNKKKELERF